MKARKPKAPDRQAAYRKRQTEAGAKAHYFLLSRETTAKLESLKAAKKASGAATITDLITRA